MKLRMRRLLSWWLLIPLLAVTIAGYLMLRSDDELHTAFTDLAHAGDFPEDLTPNAAMRILSADPLVVDYLVLAAFGVDDSPLVHTSLRSAVEAAEFDDYVLASIAVVELPCDCGPDEVPPIQPVVFGIEVVSRDDAAAFVGEEANTSGVAFRLSVDEGILVAFRDGEALFRAAGGHLYRGEPGAAAIDSILDTVDRDAVERHSRTIRARGGLQIVDRGYSYVPFGRHIKRDIPAELEPLVAELMEWAKRVVDEGEQLT